MVDLDLRPWSRLAALVVSVLLLVALYAEVANAQAQALPYSATNVPLSSGSNTFSVKLDMKTAPDRPQLRFIATPDAAHANMTLEIHIDNSDVTGVPDDGCPTALFGSFCQDFFAGAAPISWTSSSAPGAVEWVADIWRCIPAPRDEDTAGENPECKVEVTATSFGSGGSPATFNLQILGETSPVTGTVQEVVNPAGGSTTGTIETPRVPFMTDVGNFRWIYDEDQPEDNVVETFHPVSQAQLGICQAFPGVAPEDEPTDIFGGIPYSYTYVGSPSYVGFDCCTWQVDSESGTTGSGQALWYVNLGLGAEPPDSDGDGFFDPCDNCVNVPNGPFIGTCVTQDGSTVGGPCMSNQQCSGGQFCSMAQEDDDFDPEAGLVCLPEPGATALLASGVLCLVALDRRRRNARVTASC